MAIRPALPPPPALLSGRAIWVDLLTLHFALHPTVTPFVLLAPFLLARAAGRLAFAKSPGCDGKGVSPIPAGAAETYKRIKTQPIFITPPGCQNCAGGRLRIRCVLTAPWLGVVS